MDPSLVKLDTTYQVQLAYAEASSAIDFIVKQRGAEGLLGVLQALRQTQEGGTAEAVARVMGMTFDTFQEQWQQFLVAQQLQEHQGVHLPRFELKQEGKTPTDELQQELQSHTARLHARLGDRRAALGSLKALQRYSPDLTIRQVMASLRSRRISWGGSPKD